MNPFAKKNNQETQKPSLTKFIPNYYLGNCKLKLSFLILAIATASIILLSGLNSLYFSIKYAFGGDPFTYLYHGNLWGDFFQVICSYPGGVDVSPLGISEIDGYIRNNPYQGSIGLIHDKLTHFHLTPLTTVMSLLLLKAIKITNPKLVFFSMIILLFSCVYFFSRMCFKTKQERLLLFFCVVISYPFLFLLQRGNLFSAISSLFTIISLLFLYKKNHIYLSFLLMAVAINIRPNMAIFVLPFFIWGKDGVRSVAYPLVSAAFICLASMLYAHWLYPDYSFNSFFHGLRIYYDLYVIGDWGFAYSSSLYTLLKFIALKIHTPFLQLGAVNLFATSFCAFLALLVFFLRVRSKIDDIEFVFALSALNMLGTSVFADYHLLIFFLPIAILIISYADKKHNIFFSSINTSHIFILILSSIFLSPLNYYQNKNVFLFAFAKTLFGLLFIMLLIYRRAVIRLPPRKFSYTSRH